MPPRSHSNFAARTATDASQRLHRRSFAQSSPPPNERTPLLDGPSDTNAQEEDHGVEWLRSWFCNTFHLSRSRSDSSNQHGRHKASGDASKPRPGAFPRPVGGTDKLGTFAGVFVPVTLNVLSILMFLRFGFILGQTGVVGMMGKRSRCGAESLSDSRPTTQGQMTANCEALLLLRAHLARVVN